MATGMAIMGFGGGATIGAAFAGLLSSFNIVGRFFWASLSDDLGRKPTYVIFFALGFVLYASAPAADGIGQVVLFVAIFCVILTIAAVQHDDLRPGRAAAGGISLQAPGAAGGGEALHDR